MLQDYLVEFLELMIFFDIYNVYKLIYIAGYVIVVFDNYYS